MAKRSIGLEEPPKRPTQGKPTGNKLDAQRATDENDRVGMSHRMPIAQVKYLQMLAIQTGREQRDLLSEALDLLREKHGDI